MGCDAPGASGSNGVLVNMWVTYPNGESEALRIRTGFGSQTEYYTFEMIYNDEGPVGPPEEVGQPSFPAPPVQRPDPDVRWGVQYFN